MSLYRDRGQTIFNPLIFILYSCVSGPGGSVGIATDYGLDGPESNAGGDEIYCPSRPVCGPPSLLYNGYRVFPGSRGGRGVGLTPPPIPI